MNTTNAQLVYIQFFEWNLTCILHWHGSIVHHWDKSTFPYIFFQMFLLDKDQHKRNLDIQAHTHTDLQCSHKCHNLQKIIICHFKFVMFLGLKSFLISTCYLSQPFQLKGLLEIIVRNTFPKLSFQSFLLFNSEKVKGRSNLQYLQTPYTLIHYHLFGVITKWPYSRICSEVFFTKWPQLRLCHATIKTCLV